MKEKIYLWDLVPHYGLHRCLCGLSCTLYLVDGSDSGGRWQSCFIIIVFVIIIIPTCIMKCLGRHCWSVAIHWWHWIECRDWGSGRNPKYIMRWSVKPIWLWWEHVKGGSNFVLIWRWTNHAVYVTHLSEH